MYFPILFLDRWYVVVVYFSSRKIAILDCCTLCYGGGSPIEKAVRDEFVRNLSAIWKESGHPDSGFHGYRVYFADVPQQHEDLINDSGIFAMKNLEAWAINVDMMDKLNEADICHLRIKYVNDMLSSPFNSTDEGRFKVQEFDEVVYEKYYKSA
ncbi:uncharacterized protein [Miscanthus floridulus]|uniref:uncharacterized protein n=1 Tax=Miscanthus floridulus TaxID=154761 RepID=UPI00345A5AD0